MNWDKFIGTKFITTIGCGFATTMLCCFGKIDGTVYATVMIATVGAYIAGDVTQKIKEASKNAE